MIYPLYGLAESGVHWFETYHDHHVHALEMETSRYDSCLLVKTDGPELSGIVGMQTDDTLIMGTNGFATLETKKVRQAGFRCKPKTRLTPEAPMEFNGCRVTIDNDSIHLRQKNQGSKLATIDIKAKEKDRLKQYLEQRARGAYLASICQPEAAFNLSTAAQVQSPNKEDIRCLNNRIEWQINKIDRGLTYIPIIWPQQNSWYLQMVRSQTTKI